jgi:hypothetical protein
MTGDIDRLSWRARKLESAYDAILEAFSCRARGDPFYLDMFKPNILMFPPPAEIYIQPSLGKDDLCDSRLPGV